MGMARGEKRGDRGGPAGGKPVAALATFTTAAYAEHGDALRAFLVRFTHDLAAAEDLVQETFIRLLTAEGAGQAPMHVRAWLFRVAANLATSRARHQTVAARHAPALVRHEVASSPEEVLLDREAVQAVRTRIAHLPDDVRTALLLSAHGFSGAEIARRIGRTELATRSLLCRERGRLRAAGLTAA
jgi:RNA polymerase sigma factor (sigma-70 family)